MGQRVLKSAHGDQAAVRRRALMNDAGWVPGPDGIRVRDGSRLELDVLVRRPADGLPAAEQVHAAQSLDTVRRLATDLLEVTIKDEAVVLPLASLPNPWLLSSQVQGFEPAAIGGAQAWQEVFSSR